MYGQSSSAILVLNDVLRNHHLVWKIYLHQNNFEKTCCVAQHCTKFSLDNTHSIYEFSSLLRKKRRSRIDGRRNEFKKISAFQCPRVAYIYGNLSKGNNKFSERVRIIVPHKNMARIVNMRELTLPDAMMDNNFFI